MLKKLCQAAVVSALVLAPVTSAEAGDLKLTIANGRVTLSAQDVPVRQILDEWARVGGTRIVNADKLVGPPVTLELRDVPEGRALETLLRSASGYVLAPRVAQSTGASMYDRVVIMPTSRPPAMAATPQPFASRPPQPNLMPPVVDDDEPQVPVMPPGAVPANVQQFPGPAPLQPGQQPPVTTLSRPGQLPAQPPPYPGNPYQPIPQPQPVVRPPNTPGFPAAPTGVPAGPSGVPGGVPGAATGVPGATRPPGGGPGGPGGSTR
jgi:hypothetical protein